MYQQINLCFPSSFTGMYCTVRIEEDKLIELHGRRRRMNRSAIRYLFFPVTFAPGETHFLFQFKTFFWEGYFIRRFDIFAIRRHARPQRRHRRRWVTVRDLPFCVVPIHSTVTCSHGESIFNHCWAMLKLNTVFGIDIFDGLFFPWFIYKYILYDTFVPQRTQFQ